MNRIFILTVSILLTWSAVFAADDVKLINAAKTGNLKVVEELIDAGNSPDTADKNGKTLIMHAASSGKYNVAEYLLSKGANANKEDTRGYTLMHILAGNSSKPSMAFLEKVLTSGARTEDVASDGETPASILIRKGNLAGMELFLNKGDFTPDRNAKGVPSIIYAYKYGQVKIVKLLADKNAKLNVNDDKRVPLLHLAVMKNDFDTVSYLVDKGAFVDIKNQAGETPLFTAADKGSVKIMNLLVEKGANQDLSDSAGRNILHKLAVAKNSAKIIGGLKFDERVVNKKDQSGVTPIAAAMIAKRWENVKPLAEIGGDINYTDPYGKTLLMIAIEGKSADAAKYLTEKGAAVKSSDNGGATPLHLAVMNKGKNWDDIVTLIIQKGVDVNSADKSGSSPAGRAIDAGNVSGFKILSANGLNVNFREKGSVPLLLYAYRNSQKLIAAELMQKGADITAKDGDGNSILHVIAEKNDTQQYKAMASYNFDLNIKNRTGKTPLISAIEKGSFSFAQMLINEKEKVDLGMKDSAGMSVMHYLASMKGGEKLLAMEGVSSIAVTDKDSSGRTPLAIAVHANLTGNAGYFLGRGADASGSDWEGVKLVIVAYSNSRGKQMFNLLIEKGADPEAAGSDGKNLLFMSIEKKDFEAVKLLLQKNVNINKKYISGTYPLIHSIYKGSGAVIQALINAGADTNVTDDSGTTPLIAAVESKDIKTAGYLVQKGANVNVTNSAGKPLVLVAFETNRIDVFDILVAGGAKTAEAFNGNTLLHMAASANRLSFINSLIKGGADLNVRNVENKTAVMLASEKGYGNAVKTLAAGGADLSLKDSLGETALYKAVRIGGDGGYNAADALIKGGAQVNDRSSAGTPVLHEAVNGAKFQFVSLLLKGGADPNVLNGKNESAILMLARTSATGKNEQYKLTQVGKAIAELAAKGGDPNLADKYGKTPLNFACRMKSLPVIEALLKNGARVNESDQYGNTSIKKVILDFTGDYKVSDKEKKSTLQVIDLLLKNGADINAKDKTGRTPLTHILKEVIENPKIKQKVIDIVPELLKRGALAGISDNEGKTASDYAAQSRIDELKEIVR